MKPLSPSYTLGAVPVTQILALRTRVLRPHLGEGALASFDGDDERETSHYAAISEWGEVCGCVTIMRERLGASPAWRLRGMAVASAHRGCGLGAELLAFVLREMDAREQAPIWCHAREAAISLYARAGFVVVGERFELPEIGAHALMVRAEQGEARASV